MPRLGCFGSKGKFQKLPEEEELEELEEQNSELRSQCKSLQSLNETRHKWLAGLKASCQASATAAAAAVEELEKVETETIIVHSENSAHSAAPRTDATLAEHKKLEAAAETLLGEAQVLLETIALEPDEPRLLLEAWCQKANSRVLLGEQWLPKPDELLTAVAAGASPLHRHRKREGGADDAPRVQLPLQPRALFSRVAPTKPSASVLASAPSVYVQFCTEEQEDSILLSDLRVASKASVCQSLPEDVTLQIWRWGCGGEGKEAKTPQPLSPLQACSTCRLQVMEVAGMNFDDFCEWQAREFEQEDNPIASISDRWLILEDRDGDDGAIMLGRSHPLISRLLGSRKQLLQCVSREHVRFRLAKGGSGLLVDNLSTTNPAVLGRKALPIGATGISMHNGDTLSLVAPMSLLHSSGLCDTSTPLMNRASPATASTSPNMLEGSTLPPEDGEEPRQSPADRTFTPYDRTFVASHQPGAEVALVSILTLRLEAAVSSMGISRCCRAEACSGGGGDPLYEVRSGLTHEEVTLYCASCCSEVWATNERLQASLVPRKVLEPSWDLVFESKAKPACPCDVTPDSSGGGGPEALSWSANFEEITTLRAHAACSHVVEQEVRIRESVAKSTAEMLAERRAKLTEEVAAMEAEAEQSLREVVDLASQAGVNPGAGVSFEPQPRTAPRESSELLRLRDQVEKLRQDKQRLADAVEAKRLRRDAERARAEAESAKEEQNASADAETASARATTVAERAHKGILHKAEVLKTPQGGQDLVNHRRVQQLLCNDSGLLYSDDLLEVHVVVERPEGLLQSSETKERRAPTAGLLAKVTLQLQAKDGRSFASLDVSLDGIDFAALHAEPLASGARLEAPSGEALPAHEAERSFQVELIEVLCSPPSARVEATLLPADGSGAPEECSCTFWLPLLLTTFLRPLRADAKFDQDWTAPDLQAAAPLILPAPGNLQHSPAAAASETLTFGGALRSFKLRNGSLGFGAELLAHGCMDQNHVVLAHVSSCGDGNWQIAAKSQELRAAEAAAAALASMLQGMP